MHKYEIRVFSGIVHISKNNFISDIIMTRGNQRDLAREKNQKKLAKGKKASDSDANAGLTLEQRKQRDADLMRQKQEKKAKDAAEKAKK